MSNNTEVKTFGVIVGRFQVPELTDGYREVFDHVLAKGHKKVLVFLGIPPRDVRATKNNPIPYLARKQMIEEAYGNRVEIHYIQDVESTQKWSKNLDEQILTVTGGDADVVLYGSHDSFIKCYTGRFETEEFVQRILVSDTKIRENCVHLPETSLGFRLGCVYNTQQSWTSYFPTVDCAIFSDTTFTKLYMGKKAGETLLRFVGGFWDANDNTVEDAAIREAKEETGLTAVVDSYVGTAKIDDWRYRGEREKIMTTLYLMHAVGGRAAASDDLAELHLVDVATLEPEMVNEVHRPLLAMLKNHLAKNINSNH